LVIAQKSLDQHRDEVSERFSTFSLGDEDFHVPHANPSTLVKYENAI